MKIVYSILLVATATMSFLSNVGYANQKEFKTNNFALREEVQQFIANMRDKHNFDQKHLEILFKQHDTSQEVLRKISNPSEKLSWSKYKQLLISNDRVNKGKVFLAKHHDSLLKAEQQFGVPKEIIVAILGVESFYGAFSGNIPVIQSLATLSFDYPPREKFFKQELEHFLLLTKEEKLDPNNIMGSYAGAMSPAQFISSSYRAYAIDFANIGSKDLNNMLNAIGSIANYFAKHGWQKKQPITHIANLTSKHNNIDYAKYIDRNLASPAPKYSLKELNNIGFKVAKKNLITDLNKQVALMEFINENNKKEYWLGYNNFCVITKYNHSINYAMAVYQLAVKLGLRDQDLLEISG